MFDVCSHAHEIISKLTYLRKVSFVVGQIQNLRARQMIRIAALHSIVGNCQNRILVYMKIKEKV